MTHARPLNVLFICTGNICRSPLATQLLLAKLASAGIPRTAVSAKSRGTHAHEGLPMDELSARQSLANGGEPVGHTSQRLVAADLREADLVVTMTLEQRAAAARMLPVASKKAVTLLELARLVEHNPVDGGSADLEPLRQIERLLSRRSTMPLPRREAELDIADPYRKSAATHAKVARQIDTAVGGLAGWLAAAVSESVATAFAVMSPVETSPVETPPAGRNAAPAPPPPLTRRQARALRELDATVS